MKPDAIWSLPPQLRKIVNHMTNTGRITGDEAVTYYRIMALPRRISDLRERGYAIKRIMKAHPVTGQRYAEYRFDE